MDITLFYWLFFPLFAMAMGWLVMVWWLYRALASRHPDKYKGMGKPHLFLNNTLGSAVRLLKFLISGQAHALRDESLSLLVNVMRVWLVVFLVGFIVLSVAVLRLMATIP